MNFDKFLGYEFCKSTNRNIDKTAIQWLQRIFNLKWMVVHPAKNTINLFCQFEMFSWWVGVKQVQVKFVISSAGDL